MASKEFNDLLAKINSLNEELNKIKSSKADVISPHPVGASHNEGWEWAKANGIFNGKNPGGVLSRQQAATVLMRLMNQQ